jgi:hypothetical protein
MVFHYMSQNAVDKYHLINLLLIQSLSSLKSLDNFGSLFLKSIMSTLRRLKRLRGGSPARITRMRARCLANFDFVFTLT